FGLLYARYFERVFNYLSTAVGAGEAEHATQEVFRLAFEGLPAFELRNASAFRRWLFKIARNHALDQLPKLRRIAPEDPTLVLSLADRPDPSQEEELLRGLDRSEFDRLLRPLPKRQRQVLWLHYVHDLSYADIAGRFGV